MTRIIAWIWGTVCLVGPVSSLLVLSGPASAQGVTDNVIANASDAFGESVGTERVGLYGVDDVRGFSPVDAGNARIEGLYFAPVDRLPLRLVRGNKVRVGITAQRYPFPAPTGIIDYDLSVTGSGDLLTLGIETGQFGSVWANLDAQFDLGAGLRGYAGATARRVRRLDGGDNKTDIISAGLAWSPYAGASVAVFQALSRSYDDDAAPSIFPGGDYLPPAIRRRERIGQIWAERDSSHEIFGALAKLPLGAWRIDAGLFRAERRVDAAFTDLFGNTRADGTTPDRVIVADANNRDMALSGEGRAVRAFGDAALAHRLTLSLRGRTGDRRFGGVQRISLGESSLNFTDDRPRPQFAFGADDIDESSQTTVGVGYSLASTGRFSLDLGLSGSHYSKTVRFASTRVVATARDRPVTGSATGSLILSPALTLYGGYVRGFEEVSVAPANAANRGAVPPAIRTRQTDVGLRYIVTPTISLVAGLFEIAKPYYNLDEQGLYRELGLSSNRGVEMSLAGTVRPGLSVVLGNVLIDAQISGALVECGAIGPRPVGSVKRRTIASFDWRLDGGESPLSFDVSAEALSSRVGNASNQLLAPPRESVDIGLRYRFALAKAPALLRVQLANALDDYGWQVGTNGAFTYSQGRRLYVELRVDL